MEAARPTSLGDLRELEGVWLGPGSWRRVPQAVIDEFAHCTGDRQWIHTDVERAIAGPFGGTVAHGLLTLGLTNAMSAELISFEGFGHAVNYGYDRVRFPAPVRSGGRVRVRAAVMSVTSRSSSPDMLEVRTQLQLEVEGLGRPACVADSVGLLAPASPHERPDSGTRSDGPAN